MELLAENEEVLTYLSGDQSLISATLNSLLIHGTNEGITIEMVLALAYSSKVKMILLQFENVLAYALYHSADHYFYNVESYKLISFEEGYYLSLDPYDETQAIDNRDNDVVSACKVKVYKLPAD